MLDECRASHYKRIPTKSRTRGNALEDVQSFIYLRRIIINLGGTDADVTARIGKNSRTSGISYFCHNDKKREIHRLNSNIKWVLLYGAEILRMTKTVLNRVQTIINSCLRRILQMSFPDKSNICLWRKILNKYQKPEEECKDRLGTRCNQHHKTGLDMESPRKEVKKHLAKMPRGKYQENGPYFGPAGGKGTGQKTLEGSCCHLYHVGGERVTHVWWVGKNSPFHLSLCSCESQPWHHRSSGFKQFLISQEKI